MTILMGMIDDEVDQGLRFVISREEQRASRVASYYRARNGYGTVTACNDLGTISPKSP